MRNAPLGRQVVDFALGRSHHGCHGDVVDGRQSIKVFGAKGAMDLIAASKISVPLMAQTVIDRCMQMHGAGWLTEDYCMAEAFNYARWCRQADGPDQVHQMALGKQVIKRYAPE